MGTLSGNWDKISYVVQLRNQGMLSLGVKRRSNEMLNVIRIRYPV